jgi:hypothetical protein
MEAKKKGFLELELIQDSGFELLAGRPTLEKLS